jgi:acyl-ACP thioesterase
MTPDDPLEYASSFRVRFDEAGPDGLLRTSGLLRHAQDVAWQHSEARGFTRAWYADRHLAWVVRAADLEVLGQVPMGETLAVTTRVVGYQRIWAQRRAECRRADGELAAWVRTDWVLIDGRGRLTRIPAEIPAAFPAPLLDEPLLRVTLPQAPPEAHRRGFEVRPHELDPMNHPNNAVYVDWIEESIIRASADASTVRDLPRRLRLEYAAAPGPDDVITSIAWPSERGWDVRLANTGGRDLMRAIVEA